MPLHFLGHILATSTKLGLQHSACLCRAAPALALSSIAQPLPMHSCEGTSQVSMFLPARPLLLIGQYHSRWVLKLRCLDLRPPSQKVSRKLSSLCRLMQATGAPARQNPMQLETQGPHKDTPQLPSACAPALQLSPELAPAGSHCHASHMQSISMR